MSYIDFVSLLFIAWIILEIYLGWVNYKGCFRYKLREGSKLWSWVDGKIGAIRLVISPLFNLVIISVVASALMGIFNLSIEIAFASAISGMVIFRMDNVIYDDDSVKSFEKNCMKCDSKKECESFLNKNCRMEFFKNRIRMAVLNTEEEKG